MIKPIEFFVMTGGFALAGLGFILGKPRLCLGSLVVAAGAWIALVS